MSRKSANSAKNVSKLPEALAAACVLILCFAILLLRLEVLREGYRLSELRQRMAKLQEQNRELRLEVARLSSQERLRALASRYEMRPPNPEQIIEVR